MASSYLWKPGPSLSPASRIALAPLKARAPGKRYSAILGRAASAPQSSAQSSLPSSPQPLGPFLSQPTPPSSLQPRRRIGRPLVFGGSRALAEHVSSLSSALRHIRFASTQPSPPPAQPDADTPVLASAPNGATDLPGAHLQVGAGLQEGASLSDFTTSPLPIDDGLLFEIPEQIGFLKGLGLDYGSGPTAMVQWCLEHIYIWTGLPWWATILIFAGLNRLVLFRATTVGLEESRKLQELSADPQYEAMRQKLMAAFKNRDSNPEDIVAIRNEMRLVNGAAGIKTWKMLLPILQIPIAFGAVRLLRGMAALPVPSFEHGGFLWMSNLAIGDPNYLLPMLSAVFGWLSSRVSLPYLPPSQQRRARMISVIITPIMAVSLLFFPAGAQLFIVATSAMFWVQQRVIYNHRFRAWAGLSPLPQSGQLSPAPETPARSTSVAQLYQPPKQREPPPPPRQQDTQAPPPSSFAAVQQKATEATSAIKGMASGAKGMVSTALGDFGRRRKGKGQAESNMRALSYNKQREAEASKARAERMAKKKNRRPSE